MHGDHKPQIIESVVLVWMRLTLLVSLLLVSLLAGCSGPSEPDNPDSPTAGSGTGGGDNPAVVNNTTVAGLPSLELVDCWLVPMLLPVPSPLVREHLPEGYYPRTVLASAAVGSIMVNHYACGAVVVDKQTVYEDVEIVLVALSAHREEPEEGMPTAVLYQYEWFSDEIAVVEIAERAGFEARTAEIQGYDNDEEMEFSLSVDGRRWYHASTSIGGDDGGASKADLVHYHRLPNGTDVAALVETEGRVTDVLPHTGSFTAEDGFVNEFLGGAGLAWPVVAASGPVEARISFHLAGG